MPAAPFALTAAGSGRTAYRRGGSASLLRSISA